MGTDNQSCRAFHRFGQAKFAYGGSVLGSSHAIYTTAPAVFKNDTRFKSMVEIDSKMIISIPLSKSLTLL